MLATTPARIALQAVNVCAPQSVDKLLLQDISLSIAPGEQVALIGRSGAGKTMLLHTLAASIAPQSGALQIAGQAPWQLSAKARQALRKQLFLAPQTPPLPPRQRVVTTVLAGRLPYWSVWRALASLLHPAEPRAAWEALALFGLQDKLYERVDRLSGGERQRCGLARMLLSQAQIFLVDEPLSALDPTLAASTLACLQQQAHMRGASLICSLHQVELAQTMFPRLIGIRHGKIVFDAASSAVSRAMLDDLYRAADTESSEEQSLSPSGKATLTPLVIPCV